MEVNFFFSVIKTREYSLQRAQMRGGMDERVLQIIITKEYIIWCERAENRNQVAHFMMEPI
jgi:hypothetical protein